MSINDAYMTSLLSNKISNVVSVFVTNVSSYVSPYHFLSNSFVFITKGLLIVSSIHVY
jgi:hypothetical protein